MKSDNVLIGALNKYRNALFIVFILLLNLVIRGLFLDANPLERDEPFSVFHSQMGIREIVDSLKYLNNPPLYEIFLHFWIKIFGISPSAVRFPSLLFSVLTVYFIYLIAIRFFNTRVAILSVLLVTFSNYHLFFSHEARVYPLFALLTTISFYLFILIIEEKSRPRNLFLLFLTYTGLVYSHYFGIFVIILQVALLFGFRYYKVDMLKKYLAIIGCLLLTYIFYIPIVFNRFIDSSQNGTWLKPVENLGNLFDIIFLFSNGNKLIYFVFILILWGAAWRLFYHLEANKYIKGFFLFGIIPLFFLTSYSIFFKIPFIWKLTSSHVYTIGFIILILSVYAYWAIVKKNMDILPSIIIGWFLVPFLLFFIVSFKIPVFLDRYLIFIMPAFYITIALSLNYIFEREKPIYLASILLIILIIFSFNLNVSNNRFANKIVGQTKKITTSETKIIICPEQYKLTFTYYYNIGYFKDYKNLMFNLNKDKIFPVYNQTELNNILKPIDHILYIDANSDFSYPQNGIYNKLTNSYNLISKIVFQDSTIIYEFKTPKS